jgi:DNA-binding GntR family transcriptional regulator
MRANIPKLATDRGTRSPWIQDRFLLPVSSVIRAALTISIPKTMKTFGGLQHSLKMHEAIIDAIEARDETRASEAATLLISATYQRNFSLGDRDTR